MKPNLKTIRSLKDLEPDAHNASKHTPRGTALMENSIREYGDGDSMTVDRAGRIISGNQRAETLADLAMTDAGAPGACPAEGPHQDAASRRQPPLSSTHGVEWAELTGRDHAENERHAIARVAFLNALFSDPRVHALWEGWMTRSGARQAAHEIRHLLHSAGARPRRRARRGSPLSQADVPPALNRAMDRLECAWPADDLSYMAEALTFVRETLNLPWRWVAGELAAEWQIYMWAAAFGRQHWHRRLTLSPPIVPAVSFSFTPRADETAPAAIDRLRGELRGYLQTISEPAPQGRRVTRHGAHLSKWATWFYRCRVKVPADRISTLARDIRAQRAIGDSGARRQVQLGIKEAKRLLELDWLVEIPLRK